MKTHLQPRDPGNPERAFKRGFRQGAAVTLKAVCDQASLPGLYAWINETLVVWARDDRPIPPPRPPVPERDKRSAA